MKNEFSNEIGICLSSWSIHHPPPPSPPPATLIRRNDQQRTQATTVGRKSVAGNLLMELYQSVIANVQQASALLFLLSCRVNLPWRRQPQGHGTLLSITSISFRTPVGGPGGWQVWRRSSERGDQPYGRLFSATPETRGGQWGWRCYFHATFDFPLRVTDISLFIFRLLNYNAINNACPPTAAYLPFHRLRAEESSSLLAVQRIVARHRTLTSFFL